jgi:hypothetical protein
MAISPLSIGDVLQEGIEEPSVSQIHALLMTDFSSLADALTYRIDGIHAAGCHSADHDEREYDPECNEPTSG